MKTTQHTPGPWYVTGHYIEDQYGTIAKVMRPEDNAYLIATAPELLGALERIVMEADCWNGPYEGAILQAKQVIANKGE